VNPSLYYNFSCLCMGHMVGLGPAMAARWFFYFAGIFVAVCQCRHTEASGVSDESEYCSYWAAEGECEANAEYMLGHCARSCTVVGNSTGAAIEGKVAGEFDYRRLSTPPPPNVLVSSLGEDMALKATVCAGAGNCSETRSASLGVALNAMFEEWTDIPIPEHWWSSGTILLTPAIAAGIWFLFRAQCATTDSGYLDEPHWFGEKTCMSPSIAAAATTALGTTESCHLPEQLMASQREAARLQGELEELRLEKYNEIHGLRVQLELSPWRGAEFSRREYLQEARSAKMDEDERVLHEREQNAIEQIAIAQRTAAQRQSENVSLVKQVSTLQAELAVLQTQLLKHDPLASVIEG